MECLVSLRPLLAGIRVDVTRSNYFSNFISYLGSALKNLKDFKLFEDRDVWWWWGAVCALTIYSTCVPGIILEFYKY